MSKEMIRQVERLRKERDALDAVLEGLLAAGQGGKYALVVDGTVQAMFATEADAYEEGLRRFGLDAVFLVAQVAPAVVEPVSVSLELGLLYVSP